MQEEKGGKEAYGTPCERGGLGSGILFSGQTGASIYRQEY